MTYRGHSVLRTLIRCHFSPVETTGSQYLYSGSADGKIHVGICLECMQFPLIFTHRSGLWTVLSCKSWTVQKHYQF